MDVKIDATKVKALRMERSWSQEHLSGASGVSLRTVQRIETEGNASAESRLSLAAAFGVDPAELLATSPLQGPVPETFPEKDRNRLMRHAALYVVVCTGLCLLDFTQSGTITWSKWPFLGWGIGILSHGFKVLWPVTA